jgi:flagellar hook-length control protein FliK
MATTEQKTGFRLPWASEPRINTLADGADPEPPEASTEPTITEDTVTQDSGTATFDPRSMPWPTMNGNPETDPEVTTEAPAPEPTPPVAPAAAKARRDNPLVAGLVRAMRDAAQSAQAEALARFAEAAKARIESIHADSGETAAAIRHQTDQDIAGIREWSKAEMARIREETDERIADRKRKLELEVDDHAARVEHRIELVKNAVTTFESEMESFFKALLAEEDPAKLAGFAEQLPEPPALDDESQFGNWVPTRTLDADNAAAAEAELMADLQVTDADAADDGTAEDIESIDPDVLIGTADAVATDGETETETAQAVAAEAVAETETPEAVAAEAETETPEAVAAEAVAETETEAEPVMVEAVASEPEAEATSTEVAEATAEPVSETPAADGDDAAIERLATFTDPASGREARISTRLSVVGLVSVASIAGFKRAVSRAPGVSGVSVASGPNGDFIFTVQHAASTDLRTVVPELDGFAASITGDADGVLTVSASEPAAAS